LEDASEKLLRSARIFAETTSSVAELLEAIAGQASTALGATCLLCLVSEDGRWLRRVAVFSPDPRAVEILKAAFASTEVAPHRPGVVAQVSRTGKLVNVKGLALGSVETIVAPEYAERIVQLGVHSILGAPLLSRGRVAGVVLLLRHGSDGASFDEDDERCVTALCDHAALALTNAQALEAARFDQRESHRTEEQSKTFVALVETSSDLVAMASFDGQVLFLNKAGRELCGIAPDQDVRQLRLSDFHTEDGMARAAIIKAHGKWEGEGVLRNFATGALIPVQVSSFIARAENGEPLCFATIQRDLRETKRLESQLRQAQRMESLGRLAGGVAHDFNNLLTVIMGNTTLLRSAPPESSGRDRLDDRLDEIEHAAKSASELTRQLLVFGRRQVLERRIVDLREIVERLRTLFSRLIGEDIRVDLDLCAATATALVDPTQIEQIVVNLALNARDAMPDGGTLRVGVDVVVHGETAAGALGISSGPHVRISVADTGMGMAAEVRARVFDPFFTTKPIGKGTGLGLSIAYGAARQNQGSISFESEVGHGTTFFVHFPLVSAADPTVPAGRTSIPRGSERVWLVEDQPLVRSFVETALSRLGYSVRSFASGEQLLESIGALGVAQVLVTDLVLPNLDGRALAKRVVAERPGIKVVFASGYSEEVISRHGPLPEGTNFIAKPFTVEMLARAVRGALDSAQPTEWAGCQHALIIDDDPMVLTVLARLLESFGCKASAQSDPRGALGFITQAKSAGSPVEVVFLDVHLDGASGLETCKCLRQAGVDVAIICMSGGSLSARECAEAGFDDVLLKPIDHDTLRVCVERYAGWSHRARAASRGDDGTRAPLEIA
jgi:PAS domain S-box-containing protein